MLVATTGRGKERTIVGGGGVGEHAQEQSYDWRANEQTREKRATKGTGEPRGTSLG